MRPLLLHISTLTGHRQGLYAVAKGLDNGTFYTSGTDGQVAEWHVAAPETAVGLARLQGPCWAMAAVPGTGLLALTENRQGLHFIDMETRQPAGSLALGDADYFALLPTPAGLAVGDSLGRVQLVDVRERRVGVSRQVSGQSIRALALIDQRTLAAAGSDGNIRLLDLSTLKEMACWPAHAPTVMALCLLPGDRLASAGRDARIRTWDLTRSMPALLQEVPAHYYTIYDLALHPGGELLLSASMDKTLKLWDATTLRLLRVLDKARHQGHGSSVNRCIWLSSQYAVSCSDDRTAVLWRLGNGPSASPNPPHA